jgi:hypothetical protein
MLGYYKNCLFPFKTSILTAFVLELFWLEYTTGRKSDFENSIEHRMRQYGLRAKDALRRKTILPNAGSKIKLFFYKFIEAIAEEYDKKKPIDPTCVQGVKFFIDFTAAVSIEILLQKYFADELEITDNDDDGNVGIENNAITSIEHTDLTV